MPPLVAVSFLWLLLTPVFRCQYPRPNKYTGPIKNIIYKCILLSLPLVQGVIATNFVRMKLQSENPPLSFNEVAIRTVTYEHLRAIRTVCSHVIAAYCT